MCFIEWNGVSPCLRDQGLVDPKISQLSTILAVNQRLLINGQFTLSIHARKGDQLRKLIEVEDEMRCARNFNEWVQSTFQIVLPYSVSFFYDVNEVKRRLHVNKAQNRDELNMCIWLFEKWLCSVSKKRYNYKLIKGQQQPQQFYPTGNRIRDLLTNARSATEVNKLAR